MADVIVPVNEHADGSLSTRETLGIAVEVLRVGLYFASSLLFSELSLLVNYIPYVMV